MLFIACTHIYINRFFIYISELIFLWWISFAELEILRNVPEWIISSYFPEKFFLDFLWNIHDLLIYWLNVSVTLIRGIFILDLMLRSVLVTVTYFLSSEAGRPVRFTISTRTSPEPAQSVETTESASRYTFSRYWQW